MTASFSDIEAKFDLVFGFIQSDLERFLAQDAGGNFAVAALAACACETLARYRYGSGEGADVFCRLLPDGSFQVIAKSLFDLMRNGLVHRYDCGRRKSRTSSKTRQKRAAVRPCLNPPMGRYRCLMPGWSCSK
jgi:hypothetical protein